MLESPRLLRQSRRDGWILVGVHVWFSLWNYNSAVVAGARRKTLHGVDLFGVILGWSLVVFCGLAVLLSLYAVLSSRRHMRLDARGLALCSNPAERFYAWPEIASFKVAHWWYRPIVRIELSEQGRLAHPPATFPWGFDGNVRLMNDYGGLSARALAELLNHWREAHSPGRIDSAMREVVLESAHGPMAPGTTQSGSSGSSAR